MKGKTLMTGIIFAVCLLAIISSASDTPQVGKEFNPAGTIGGPMMYIPEGDFIMGCSEASDINCWEYEDEKISHKVYLDLFYIDKYAVTVEQFEACVKTGKCSKPDTFAKCNWGVSSRKNHPINCIDWNQAKAYCEWAGKRLPTEAEWEKAARGTDARKYPWGNQDANCLYAVMSKCEHKEGCGRHSTWPVGSKPKGASPYGAMDMAGNVFNWVADWYDAKYYQNSMGRNPKGPSLGKYHVLRGGSWKSCALDLRSSNRIKYAPNDRDDDFGFRCAKSP